MWHRIKRFFINIFHHHTKVDTPPLSKPTQKDPEAPTTDGELPKKGWFPEYDEYIREGIKDKGHMLEYSRDPEYWVCFFKAVAKAESNHDPYSTYWEKKLNGGVDPITGMKYLSEGLLQLSYVDAKWHGCNFCIEQDRNKASDDKTKSIFNPKNNLNCGMIILNKLMRRHDTPFWNKGHYWAVLKPRNKRHKVFKKYLNQYLEEVMNV